MHHPNLRGNFTPNVRRNTCHRTLKPPHPACALDKQSLNNGCHPSASSRGVTSGVMSTKVHIGQSTGGGWHKALVVGSVSLWQRLLASRP